MVIAVVLVCVLLLAVFIVAALAGGRAHDRQNAQRDQARRTNSAQPSLTTSRPIETGSQSKNKA